MKRFNTKKDLLRYLGKNEDDRKLVTRMVARGEVRLEWRVYIIDEEGTDGGRMQVSEVPSNSSDLDYLNKEYERIEGLLDYSLRRCYGIMKKRGLVGSEDTYDDFYENITAWYSDERITDGYQWESESERWNRESENVAERGNGWGKDLSSVMSKFGVKRASDFIS